MTIKELIQKLEKLSPDSRVVISIGNKDGCDSCGYGETSSECEIVSVVDLETRVVLER